MTLNIPRSAIVFSLKNFLSGMIALYIALAAGFENPAWAVVTAYVVAQPHAGASLSKATYRVGGTFVGACAAIFMVPPLVQTPLLLSLVLAVWLGACVSASMIDRSARSYLFALAGYTSCIIIFPILTHPEDVFAYGISRFEEITIGILCSAIVHAVVFPVYTASILKKRLDKALADGRTVCMDALTPDEADRSGTDRQQLAVAINELHELLLHLRFEAPYTSARILTIRATLTKLERLMPLSLAVADRIGELDQLGSVSEPLREFLAEARHWLASEQNCSKVAEAGALLSRCQSLRPLLEKSMNWNDALMYNLLERTAELIRQHVSILQLGERVDKTTADRDSSAPRPSINRESASALLPRDIDRDWRGAAGAGLASMLTVALGNALWIGSGWVEGYSAPMMAGVYFAVYSGTSDPSLMLKNKFVGVVLRLLLGLIYMEAILPAISDFEALVLALAPALLTVGVMMALPRFSAISFNFVVGIFSPTIVDRTFHPSLELYLNSSLATLCGIYFAMFMVSITRFLWVDGIVRRTLAAGRSDIANLRYITAASQPLWRSRMAHRIGLLTPRMAAASSATSARPDDALRDMMTGGALAQLYTASNEAPTSLRTRAQSLVHQVADHYRNLQRRPDLVPPETLRAQIDECLAQAACGEMVDPAAVLALTSLRRDMFPNDHSPPTLIAPPAKE
ncbi:FUSC family protein [Pseudomonas veronii]